MVETMTDRPTGDQTTEIPTLAFEPLAQERAQRLANHLRLDAAEIAGGGADNEAGRMRQAADEIERLLDECVALRKRIARIAGKMEARMASVKPLREQIAEATNARRP
jgi:hypothetical protein